jgi:predicted nucleic acid-binding protein
VDLREAQAAPLPEPPVILVDAGPLVALVDASDGHHARCVDAMKELEEPMATVWPAVTEALFLLMDLPQGQDAVLEMLRRGAVRLAPLGQEDIPRMQELMTKYRDQPMDLADAALVRVAERDGLGRVFTIDRRDFEVYRIGKRRTFQIIPEGSAGRARRGPRRRRRS